MSPQVDPHLDHLFGVAGRRGAFRWRWNGWHEADSTARGARAERGAAVASQIDSHCDPSMREHPRRAGNRGFDPRLVQTLFCHSRASCGGRSRVVGALCGWPASVALLLAAAPAPLVLHNGCALKAVRPRERRGLCPLGAAASGGLRAKKARHVRLSVSNPSPCLPVNQLANEKPTVCTVELGTTTRLHERPTARKTHPCLHLPTGRRHLGARALLIPTARPRATARAPFSVSSFTRCLPAASSRPSHPCFRNVAELRRGSPRRGRRASRWAGPR